MKFLVVTFVPVVYKDGKRSAYGPYVKEMDLWFRHADEIMFVCPKAYDAKGQLLRPFETNKPFKHLHIPEFDLTTWPNRFKAIPQIFFIMFQMLRGMWWAQHIHLRCPGNTGLIAAFLQVLFPFKQKTAKYAGNWDWNSKQPWSYRMQQRILRNTFFTHHMQVMVYGNWPDKNRNIAPFFTASYSEKEIVDTPPRHLDQTIKLMYVGYMTPNKRPMLSVQVAEALHQKGIAAELNMFGNGSEKPKVEAYVAENKLEKVVKVHGNQPSDTVKAYFQQSHFLVFISQSEGWPKVVAESMFWGCVPITTRVSCVPEMVGNGRRGTLVSENLDSVLEAIEHWLANPAAYQTASAEGMDWSRNFTLEKFEAEIKKLMMQ